MKHALAGLAAAVLAATPVVAQERPMFAPSRDVTIDYTVDSKAAAPNAPRSVKMWIAQGGTRMRIDALGNPGYVIFDRVSGRTVMVLDKQHAYMEMPSSPAMANLFVLNDKMGFTRKGTDTVAGLSCTVWEVKRDNGPGTACITADGLLLRGDSADGNSHMIATKVSTGSLADSVFQPPAGYKKVDMPAARPGMPGAAPPKP
jgi:hypothetical protein